MNVAEVIPYKNYKEKFAIVFQELMKNRHVEVWDKYIYSAKKWGVRTWEKNAERVFLTQKKKVAKC
ncbi:MAG: hypothetical protein WAO24_08940 [Peptococcia bacterium]